MDIVVDALQSIDHSTRYGRMLINNSNNPVHSSSLESTERILFAHAKTPQSEFFRAIFFRPL